MAELIVYIMGFIGLFMTLYFWYQSASTDYLEDMEIT